MARVKEVSEGFVQIERTTQAQDKYGHAYGSSTYGITRDDIIHLLEDGQLAMDINGR